MSYKIIVSRFNESIEWLNLEKSNCIIYNKGLPLNISNEIIVNNVGRESETYLRYIIDNYDNLPDVIVFTQAKISDHYPNKKDDINYLLKLKNEALIKGKSNPIIIHNVRNMDIPDGSPWHPLWNLIDNIKYYLNDNYKDNNRISFIDWFKININTSYPNPIKIYSNAIFSVKKEFILKNTKEYYENLILNVNFHDNPAEGHFFERSWYYIFKD